MSAAKILRDAGVEVPEAMKVYERERCNSFSEDPAFEQGRSYLRDNAADPALEALAREVVKWEAVSRINAEECNKARDEVVKWKWVAREALHVSDDVYYQNGEEDGTLNLLFNRYEQEAEPCV